jgi:hypothetical protein
MLERQSVFRDLEDIGECIFIVHESFTGEILRLELDGNFILPVFKGDADANEYIFSWMDEPWNWNVEEIGGGKMVIDSLRLSMPFCHYLTIQPPLCRGVNMDLVPLDESIKTLESLILF